MNLSILLCSALLQGAVDGDALASLPVREITVFKDGHAFVLHEGQAPVDEAGDVLLEHLPRPILGTFWPYAAEPGAELVGVVAGTRQVSVSKDAGNLVELLRANIGGVATISERSGKEYTATIASLPAEGTVILLRTEMGMRVVAISDIRNVTFHGVGNTALDAEEARDLMTLRLDWRAEPPARARVGMAYLQKGLRWIPHYRVSIDGEGQATIQLQATLINELIDLENVTTNLVIGVPSFAFEDTLDPIALQQVAAALSPYFQENQQTAYALSNFMVTQVARRGEYGHVNSSGSDSGSATEMPGVGGNEDHFIFTIPAVTLRKGERMVVPVVEFTLPYRDVFTLDLPLLPPPELQQQFSNQQQQDLARLFSRPKVMHQLRIENTSSFPLTTAPALILKDGRLIAQGLMTYTPLGCNVDLELTAAVDIPLDKEEEELGRTPNDIVWHGNNFDRVDLRGELRLFNRKQTSVVIEVTRLVLGDVDRVDGDGRAQKVNLFEDDGLASRLNGPYHSWWAYGTNLWNRVNGVSRITWEVELEPGKSAELGYGWHYFVR
jgi:hypothetical protein